MGNSCTFFASFCQILRMGPESWTSACCIARITCLPGQAHILFWGRPFWEGGKVIWTNKGDFFKTFWAVSPIISNLFLQDVTWNLLAKLVSIFSFFLFNAKKKVSWLQIVKPCHRYRALHEHAGIPLWQQTCIQQYTVHTRTPTLKCKHEFTNTDVCSQVLH